ncbi:HAMP domain-containing sensor histidine kinase [Peribacillus sp. NPDC006672]|uniref:HAMP domain-containing sensor histidine kinase n=1 Tax=Peribacillus sp. NPDC006672 TaxID=3390606 RepID=UPI003D018ED1
MIKSNKISTKLLSMVSIIMVIVFGVSYLLNNYFLSDYYLYKMKQKLTSTYDEINELSISELMEIESSTEDTDNVTIVIIENNGNIDELNELMQFSLYKDKIPLNKFWITEDTLKKVSEGNAVKQLYNQGKIKSSLLTLLYEQEGHLILIGTVVVHNTDAMNIINQLNFYSIVFGIIITLLLVAYYSRRIITPLEKLQSVAKDIANLNFKQVNIKSGDEIEELSYSINDMSTRLKNAHLQLEKKNQNLNSLVSNISHEVKTPLSLIQAYTIGIKDGLDDGTYTNVILEQVKNTSDMVDHLIMLAKVQALDISKETFDLREYLQQLIVHYKILLNNKGIEVRDHLASAEKCMVKADKSQMDIVFNNLISNAIKYGEENFFFITLENDLDGSLKFDIKNKTTIVKDEHLQSIWDSFYVIEESRNKEISGTGLGLALVANILDKNDVRYEVTLKEKNIHFTIWFDTQ